MKMNRNEFINEYRRLIDKLSDCTHQAVSQGVISWEEHDKLIQSCKKARRDIEKIEQNNNDKGGH